MRRTVLTKTLDHPLCRVPSSGAVAGHDRSGRRERLDVPHAFGFVMSFMPKPLSTNTNPSLAPRHVAHAPCALKHPTRSRSLPVGHRTGVRRLDAQATSDASGRWRSADARGSTLSLGVFAGKPIFDQTMRPVPVGTITALIARAMSVGEILIKRSLRGAGHNVNWRRGRDSNPRYGYPYAAFRVRCFQPLSHLSALGARGRYLAPRGKRSLNEPTGTKQAHHSAPRPRKSSQLAIKATLTTVLRFPRRVVWYRDPKTARVC